MTENTEPVRVTSDIGPFAIVPVWLLETGASGNAIRIYAMLASYADRTTGAARPARSTLAKRLGISTDTVDRGTRELEDLGAVTVQSRYEHDTAGGGGARQTTNGYTIRFARPEGRISAEGEEGRSAEHPGRISAAAGTRPPINQTKNTLPVAPPTMSITGAVDRKPVTLVEAELAQAVLDEWNGQTGQALRSRDWLAKIVGRAREHPEFTAVDHAHLIAANLAAPWWKGPATPSVVYGSGSQFERAILAANGDRSARASPPMRYGRGMTTRQILDATEGLE